MLLVSPKVVFVAPSAYPLGGLATWLDYLVPGLVRRGWQVTVVLTAGAQHDANAYLDAHPFADAVTVEAPTGTREGRIRRLADTVSRLAPDLVVSVNIPDVYPAVKRLRRRGGSNARVVMTAHGIQPDLYEDAREHAEVLDAVVATNRLACRLAEVDGGISPDRVWYVPYGVAVDEPSRGTTRTRSDVLHVGYSGRLDRFQKRVHDLPRILWALRSRGVRFQLLIAGSGPEQTSLRNSLDRMIAAGQVQLLGTLSGEEMVQRFYRRIDALLIPSSWETGPIVAWEAMAHGVAVVTSTYVGSGREGSLRHGDNCLMFQIGDTEAAAACLARVADRAVRRRLAAAGYSLVAKRYSMARSVALWSECLATLAERPPLPPGTKRPQMYPAGRLDRLLGSRVAETLREVLGRSYQHREPGGEWPHSYGYRSLDDATFWSLARRLDLRDGDAAAPLAAANP